MKHTKKILITTETSETLIFRQATPRRVWCEACGAEAEMVAPEIAARVAGMRARTVYRLIEAGGIHFAETPDGSSLVCLKTLTQVEKREDEDDV